MLYFYLFESSSRATRTGEVDKSLRSRILSMQVLATLIFYAIFDRVRPALLETLCLCVCVCISLLFLDLQVVWILIRMDYFSPNCICWHYLWLHDKQKRRGEGGRRRRREDRINQDTILRPGRIMSNFVLFLFILIHRKRSTWFPSWQ